MKIIDEFGKDPTIQRTRKLFSIMEKADSDLVQSLNLSPFDERLRNMRTMRLYLYEKGFSLAVRKSINVDESFALQLFMHCQKIGFTKSGFSYESDQPENPEITALIQEALR